jgi:hypothetical protein
VHIQGFNGYLNSRFFTEEDLWRDRTIFGLSVPQIKQVSIQYSTNTQYSFYVNTEGGKVSLTDAKGNQAPFLNVNMNIFLGALRTANYEAMVVPTDGIWAKRDSLQQATPLLVLSITDVHDQTHALKAYRKRPDHEQEDENGQPLQWDPDRLYAFLSDGRMVLIQYYGLRNVLVTLPYFNETLRMDN